MVGNKTRASDKNKFLTKLQLLAFVAVLLLTTSAENVRSANEIPVELPRSEGSKSFDMEIDQLNHQGVEFFHQKNFDKATAHFKKALHLSQQLRDPAQGILNFNLALSLHALGQHEAATPYFAEARKFARGNKVILQSGLLRMHECGFNPSVDCKDQPPASMHIEGSD